MIVSEMKRLLQFFRLAVSFSFFFLTFFLPSLVIKYWKDIYWIFIGWNVRKRTRKGEKHLKIDLERKIKQREKEKEWKVVKRKMGEDIKRERMKNCMKQKERKRNKVRLKKKKERNRKVRQWIRIMCRCSNLIMHNWTLHSRCPLHTNTHTYYRKFSRSRENKCSYFAKLLRTYASALAHGEILRANKQK